jgi:predicted RNase H-like HicB family nuclease
METTMRCYIALLHKEDTNRYRIELADFPGCAGWCDSLEDAARIAGQILAEEIDLRRISGEGIPRPAAPEDVAARAAALGAAPIVVPMPAVADRVTIDLDLPAGLVERVDRRARLSGVERADLIERAARHALWETGRAERSPAPTRGAR